MRRLILLLATTGVAVLLASGAALGITYGTDDDPNNPRYPGVGALVDGSGAYCSGTLVAGKNSDPVFVTAAHCDYPGRVYVTFEPEYKAEGKRFADVGVGVKEYRGTLIDTGDDQWYRRGYDIAVVVFDAPDAELRDLPTAKLPRLGELDDLQKGQLFTAVGYGVDETLANEGVRRYSVSSLTSENSYYLSLSQHQRKGYAGTCYGDSGGPNFFGATVSGDATYINAALTNTGDAQCKTKNTVLRLDTLAAQGTQEKPGFLRKYVSEDAFVEVQ